MKTAESFYKEITASKELQEELQAVSDETSIETFLRKHDCKATAKDFTAYVTSSMEGEIDDIDADSITGGSAVYFPEHMSKVLFSPVELL